MGRLMIAAGLLASLATSGSAESAPALRLERVVVLMRHGVRPPTKEPPMPGGTAAQPWPRWPVAPGYLTPHGASAVRLLGAADRRWLSGAGLLPAHACPPAGAIRVRADSDQRTIATGDAWLAGFAAGCAIVNQHRPQDEPDPLFAAAGENGEPFDPAKADAAVARALGPGGIAAVEAAMRDRLARLNRILCGSATASCGVGRQPTTLVPAAPGKRPKLSGALDRGSTAAQILLLEHAEGKPAVEVGWGRATAADVAALGTLHSVEFALLARPPYIAAANAGPIARALLAALASRDGARVELLVGHDTNVASLGGLLDLHWRAPGYAADDPPPGGALLFELLRDRLGRRIVRVTMRAQGLDALRRLRADGAAIRRETLAIPGCGTLCPVDRFVALLRARLPAPGGTG